MTTNLEIRPVADCDVAAIQSSHARHLLHGLASWELVPPDVADLNARRDGILKDGYSCVVAVLDDNLVGYAYAEPYWFRPAYRYTVENTVYLHPDQQGRRIARPLLQRVTD